MFVSQKMKNRYVHRLGNKMVYSNDGILHQLEKLNLKIYCLSKKKKKTHMVEYVQYTTHVYQNTEYYILFTDHRD